MYFTAKRVNLGFSFVKWASLSKALLRLVLLSDKKGLLHKLAGGLLLLNGQVVEWTAKLIGPGYGVSMKVTISQLLTLGYRVCIDAICVL